MTGTVAAVAQEVEENYIAVFMDTLFALQTEAQGYQRVLLTYKANEKRAEFLADLTAIRQELADCLAEVRAAFVSEINAEWNAVLSAQDDARSRLYDNLDRLSGQW